MKKLLVLASFVAMASPFAIQPSFAQSYSYSEVVMADHSMRTSKLVGLPVVNDQGQKVGTIVDVLVKDSATDPVVVLSVGDFLGGGAKMVATPLSHLQVGKTEIMMPGATKQLMTRMQAYAFNPLSGGGG